MQVGPQDCAAYPVRDIEQVVVVGPIDPQEREAQHVAQKYRNQRPQVTELGTVPRITPRTIESLFVGDFGYLQDFYRIINFSDPTILNSVEAGTPFPRDLVEAG